MSSESSKEKSFTSLSVAVDAVLVAGFFVLMFTLLRPHVPSDSALNITIWAVLTSACMTGTFWIAIQMFRVVLKGQRERDAARK